MGGERGEAGPRDRGPASEIAEVVGGGLVAVG